jgi:hypothetical protein
MRQYQKGNNRLKYIVKQIQTKTLYCDGEPSLAFKGEQIMNSYKATGLAEGFLEGTEEEQLEAWQFLIDSGLAWSLQGWFGRTAASLIENGVCTPPASD